MIKTRTAKQFLAAAALSAASFTGFAGIAGADTIAPAPQETGPIIGIPAPQPQPDPPAPEPELPIAQPEPSDPTPDLPLDSPNPGEDPQPFDPPIGVPTPDEDPEPEVPTNDDLEADLGCQFTHGCNDEGSIDDITSAGDDGTDVDGDGCVEIIGGPEVCPEETPGDEPGDTPGEDTPADEPGNEGGSLPRTGAGVALLAAVGSALTAAGLAAKKLARR